MCKNDEDDDDLKVPNLPPGDYVLGWRWDCEESTQVKMMVMMMMIMTMTMVMVKTMMMR